MSSLWFLPPQFPVGCRAPQVQLDKGSEAAGGIVSNHAWLGQNQSPLQGQREFRFLVTESKGPLETQ